MEPRLSVISYGEARQVVRERLSSLLARERGTMASYTARMMGFTVAMNAVILKSILKRGFTVVDGKGRKWKLIRRRKAAGRMVYYFRRCGEWNGSSKSSPPWRRCSQHS